MKKLIIISNLLLFINCASTYYVYSSKITNLPANWENTKLMSKDDPNYPDKGKYALLGSGSVGLTIVELDGEEIQLDVLVIILPGKHSIRVKYEFGRTYSVGTKTVNFDIKVNQTALICSNLDSRNWNPSAIVIDGYILLHEDATSPCN
jgi:hypothetical protein